jgi:glucoamylase
VKLLRSLKDGRVFDMPPQTVQRYQVESVTSPFAIWRYNHKCRRIPRGKQLRIEVLAPALIRWSADDWRTFQDSPTVDSGLGIHYADLPTEEIPAGGHVTFTFLWLEEGRRWEERDFQLEIVGDTL